MVLAADVRGRRSPADRAADHRARQRGRRACRPRGDAAGARRVQRAGDRRHARGAHPHRAGDPRHLHGGKEQQRGRSAGRGRGGRGKRRFLRRAAPTCATRAMLPQNEKNTRLQVSAHVSRSISYKQTYMPKGYENRVYYRPSDQGKRSEAEGASGTQVWEGEKDREPKKADQADRRQQGVAVRGRSSTYPKSPCCWVSSSIRCSRA